ncbi:mucoidy inhibitor MuiA family protein [Aquimarina agarivorans]|uniref:mucoidy inhibitor MuiA family protein n=1 Tax=Aquimarina agarivorans TaxID=980584 RepID=UPI000248E7F6|nr:mucoidy inhibitor MuiA family protein [Aquimarina agarivorans]
MRKLYIITLLFLTAMSALANDGVKIKSTIKDVTLYLSGARLKRTATVQLKKGKNKLILPDLSTDIDESSIQVTGLENVNVLSINYSINYLEKKSVSTKLQELFLEKEQLLLTKDQLDNLQTGLEKELNLLQSNQQVNSNETDLSLEKIKQISSYYRDRTTAILNSKYANNIKIKALNKKIGQLNNEINKLEGNTQEERGEILLILDTDTLTSLNLMIHYNVKNAGWFPEYDLKSKNINSDLDITYKANVYQNTGTVWNNVNVSLSTGDPSLNNNKPLLESKRLNFVYGRRSPNRKQTTNLNYKYNPTVKNIKGTVTGNGYPLPGVTVTIPGTSNSAVTDFNGNYAISVPSNSKIITFDYVGFTSETIPIHSSIINVNLQEDVAALEEVVIIGYGEKKKSTISKALASRAAGVQVKGAQFINQRAQESYNQNVEAKEEGVTNTTFIIKKQYSIDSNNETTAIEIDKFQLPTKYTHYVAPELNERVFLTATLSNWEKFNLLTGEANVYFEGNYAGKALIEPDGTTEKLVLSLGVDPTISVTRKSPQNLKSKSFIGTNRIVDKSFEITVKNNKSASINLILEDRIPISDNKEIKVEDVVINDAKYDSKKGILKWVLAIPSNQVVKKEFSYRVKFPKGNRINL